MLLCEVIALHPMAKQTVGHQQTALTTSQHAQVAWTNHPRQDQLNAWHTFGLTAGLGKMSKTEQIMQTHA